MRKSRFAGRASIAAGAALMMLTAAPVAANAAQEDRIEGYSKKQFVAAAVAQGVDAERAAGTWGDMEAMAAIPVASVGTPGEAPLSPQEAALAFGPYNGTCQKYWTNLFGGEVMRVKITKTWSSTATAVTSPSAQFYATASFP